MEATKSPSIFLDNLDLETISEKDEYNLQDEFKSSVKNRNWNIYFILIGMVVFLALLSWGITRWIQARNTITDYQLDEFQDVDLMGVLNQVNNIEKKMDSSQRELSILRGKYKKAGQDIIDDFDRQIRLLESQNIGIPELRTKKADLLNQKETSLAEIDSEFLEKIAVEEENILLLQEQISAFDSEKILQAQEYESVMANEKVKFEIEKQQIIDSFETQIKQKEIEYSAKINELTEFQAELEKTLKTASSESFNLQYNLFNPIVPSDKPSLKSLLERPIVEERLVYTFSEPDSNWINRGYINNLEISYMDESINNWRSLMDFVKDIPFTNDVPLILKQLEYQYLNTIDLVMSENIQTFEKLEKVEKKLEESIFNETINEKYIDFYQRLNYSLTLKLNDLGGQGIIIDSRGTEGVLAYLDPLLDVSSGTPAYVFNLEDEYIADIIIHKDELLYTVDVQFLLEGKELTAFDRIFLNMNSMVKTGSEQ